MEDITEELKERLKIELFERYYLFDNIRDLIENYKAILTSNVLKGNIGIMGDVRLEDTRLVYEDVRGCFDIYNTYIVDNEGLKIEAFFAKTYKPKTQEQQFPPGEFERILNPRLSDRFSIDFRGFAFNKKPKLYIKAIQRRKDKGDDSENRTSHPPSHSKKLEEVLV